MSQRNSHSNFAEKNRLPVVSGALRLHSQLLLALALVLLITNGGAG